MSGDITAGCSVSPLRFYTIAGTVPATVPALKGRGRGRRGVNALLSARGETAIHGLSALLRPFMAERMLTTCAKGEGFGATIARRLLMGYTILLAPGFWMEACRTVVSDEGIEYAEQAGERTPRELTGYDGKRRHEYE